MGAIVKPINLPLLSFPSIREAWKEELLSKDVQKTESQAGQGMDCVHELLDLPFRKELLWRA